MLNITKLSIWPVLEALGFVPIRYHAHGQLIAVGASLQQDHIDVSGKAFKSDLITIVPHSMQFSDNKNYHITGKIKKPYYEQIFRIDGMGRKEPITELKDHMNEYFTARDILKTVQLMLKED